MSGPPPPRRPDLSALRRPARHRGRRTAGRAAGGAAGITLPDVARRAAGSGTVRHLHRSRSTCSIPRSIDAALDATRCARGRPLRGAGRRRRVRARPRGRAPAQRDRLRNARARVRAPAACAWSRSRRTRCSPAIGRSGASTTRRDPKSVVRPHQARGRAGDPGPLPRRGGRARRPGERPRPRCAPVLQRGHRLGAARGTAAAPLHRPAPHAGGPRVGGATRSRPCCGGTLPASSTWAARSGSAATSWACAWPRCSGSTRAASRPSARPTWRSTRPRPADVSLDSSRARAVLGWGPRPLDEAIRAGRLRPD